MGFTWFKRASNPYGARVETIVDEDGVERVVAHVDSFPPSEWLEDSFYHRCKNCAWWMFVYPCLLIAYPFCRAIFWLFIGEENAEQKRQKTLEENESK